VEAVGSLGTCEPTRFAPITTNKTKDKFKKTSFFFFLRQKKNTSPRELLCGKEAGKEFNLRISVLCVAVGESPRFFPTKPKR
jgi:hypothetical protein